VTAVHHTAVHHTAVVTTDVAESLRFWRDGLGLAVLMDATFDGDWPTLLRASGTRLRSVFLGDPAAAAAGVVELVELPSGVGARQTPAPPAEGFLLVSLFTDLDATLDRLVALGLGGEPRRITAYGSVGMACVRDPSGVLVELVDSGTARLPA